MTRAPDPHTVVLPWADRQPPLGGVPPSWEPPEADQISIRSAYLIVVALTAGLWIVALGAVYTAWRVGVAVAGFCS